MLSPIKTRRHMRDVFEFLSTMMSGLLLGGIIALVQTAQQPIDGADLAAIWLFIVTAGFNCSLFGICWAFLARIVEPRLSLSAIFAVSTLTVLVLAYFGTILDRAVPIAVARNLLGSDTRLTYLLWNYAFYGGLYMMGFVGFRRAMHSRDTLARIRTARDHSVAVLEETRLDAFRHQLRPRTMLDALNALRLLYRRDPGKADDLLDLLVVFLRAAVRSLSAQVTTFSAELDLACRYLQLRALTDGDEGASSCDSARPPPDVAFPPGLFMPLIQQLNMAGGKVSLEAGWVGNVYCAALTARGLKTPTSFNRLRCRAEAIPSPRGAFISAQVTSDKDSFSWVLRVRHLRGEAQEIPTFSGAHS